MLISSIPVHIGLGDAVMTESTITQQLVQQVDQLPLEFQRKVLDFAQALALAVPKGVSGRSLLRFAGAIEVDDLRAMSEAIEAGCEQVDADEW
jgi:hypothetical protein